MVSDEVVTNHSFMIDPTLTGGRTGIIEKQPLSYVATHDTFVDGEQLTMHHIAAMKLKTI